MIADRTMYISGQIGLDVNTGTIVPGGAVPEAEQVYKNFSNVKTGFEA